MQICTTILDAIGNTPLVRLNRVSEGVEAEILAKLENLNPGGSVKDRIGVAMLQDAEKKGLLKPGGTIIEPTSGNTGTGLAIVACVKGYKMIFTMPDKMSEEKRSLLRAYGAKVVVTPTNVPPDSPEHYIKVAERLALATPTSYMPNQYDVEGIGEDFMPKTMDMTVVDDVIQISDKDAFDCARRLAREEGILVGGSGGAAACAALKAAEKMRKGQTIVTLLPDTGRNYL